jgi:predicted  nucleic acid-binding Zn-ribbon protein
MTGIDIQIANLKNKITAKKLQLEHRVTILTEGVRDAEERERLQSEISELTAAKQELERQVSALDLEQRKAAAAEESRKMSLERAAASGEFE